MESPLKGEGMQNNLNLTLILILEGARCDENEEAFTALKNTGGLFEAAPLQ